MFFYHSVIADVYEKFRVWWANWWAQRRCTQCGSLWHTSLAHCQEHELLIDSMYGCPACEAERTYADVGRKIRVAAEAKQQERDALASAIAEKIVEKLNRKD